VRAAATSAGFDVTQLQPPGSADLREMANGTVVADGKLQPS
jgi:hypothetical protein